MDLTELLVRNVVVPEHVKKDDAEGVNVSLETIATFVLGRSLFGRRESQGPHARGQLSKGSAVFASGLCLRLRVHVCLGKLRWLMLRDQLFFVDTPRKTEIAEPSIVLRIQKDIFRLNVPVNNLVLVEVIDSFEGLPEDFPLEGLICLQRVPLEEVFQGLSVAQLHLDVQDDNAFIFIRIALFLLTADAVEGVVLGLVDTRVVDRELGEIIAIVDDFLVVVIV